jgi:tRNA 5-methylaminomethyl-2-thiouridine biosynthesis bifunctional protein
LTSNVISAGDVPPSPVVWEDGAPRSRLHGDVYFSRDDGLAESRAVFLAGCGLPEAWADRRRFTVGEVGFGTGLNIAALLEAWARTRPPGGHLSVFTIEAFPLVAEEAARALATWPELAPIAALMTARWPGRARGFHRIDLPELAAVVDVAVMEAADGLSAWDGAADAWFLDGFAPTLDPDIWRPEVIDLVARRSTEGAAAATYTVAGSVRRTLAAAGFAVAKAPGHGRKRQRLEARLEREGARPPGRPADPRVAIVGAGVAGAALRRAFAALGVEAAVFDADGPGAGASGAPAVLMAPRLDAGLAAPAALFAQAARTAARVYEGIPAAVLGRGALQLEAGPKDPSRFSAIAQSTLFEPLEMSVIGASEASARVGEPAPPGLAMTSAMVIEPAVVLGAWLGAVTRTRVAAMHRAGDNPSAPWRLLDEAGAVLAEAEVVCVAAAMGTGDLVPGLGLTPVRGQASFTDAADPTTAAIFGAYVIPTRRGILFGATHDRGDTSLEPRPEDRRRNLEAVGAALPKLARALAAIPLADWCAVRATTRDYLPLAGQVAAHSGVWVLTGLGSRGFCLAPLLAEHLASTIVGSPSPLPHALAALVDPGRFAARAARKGRPGSEQQT